MLVIADTSPINYLVWIDLAHIQPFATISAGAH